MASAADQHSKSTEAGPAASLRAMLAASGARAQTASEEVAAAATVARPADFWCLPMGTLEETDALDPEVPADVWRLPLGPPEEKDAPDPAVDSQPGRATDVAAVPAPPGEATEVTAQT
mmetsp:Transcript_22028/g.45675  ORF Transcript_22028/g.45675 Transcript_22028/m.45675 type:complete len:118 (-) Transcript_22028:116-469(-)